MRTCQSCVYRQKHWFTHKYFCEHDGTKVVDKGKPACDDYIEDAKYYWDRQTEEQIKDLLKGLKTRYAFFPKNK